MAASTVHTHIPVSTKQSNPDPSCKPFLRWAGGKRWLIPFWTSLVARVPFQRYHEPFLGSGAMFFSLPEGHDCFLSDVNPDLIKTYEAVKNTPNDVIKAFRRLKNTSEIYYKTRKQQPRLPSQIAARFIYLNQTSFNGLYRVNRDGEYNVPFGNRNNWHYDTNRIILASDKLKRRNTVLSAQDFHQSFSCVGPGDLVFLDPPYAVSNNGSDKENGFVAYNDTLFSLEDQRHLADCIRHIRAIGAFYVLTNANDAIIKRIFDFGDTVIQLSRHSHIAGNADKRKRITESIFTNITLNIKP